MSTAGRHIVLFDLYAEGHHLYYIHELVRYWSRYRLPGRLDVVIPQSAETRYPPLIRALAECRSAGVQLVPITEPVAIDQPRRFDLLQKDRDHGRLLRRYLEQLRPDHAVLMYVDHAQVSLATGLRFPFPVELSGIYFRPSFHYPDLQPDAPRPGGRERLVHLRKRLVLRGAVRNPHLSILFCLDPYVVDPINALPGATRAVHLPDGTTISSPPCNPEEIRTGWRIEEGREVALLFGSLDERKGIFAAIDAAERLPNALQRRLSIVFAGRVQQADQHRFETTLHRVRRSTDIQWVRDERFIPDAEIQALVQAADVMLLPYQYHVGSSNVLIRAAAEQTPVLGPTYGLVGAHIRRHALGLAVDMDSPERLTDALQLFLETPGALPADPERMRAFAEANTIERFGATLFDTIFAQP